MENATTKRMEALTEAKTKPLYFCEFTPHDPTNVVVKWCPIARKFCEGVLCMFWKKDIRDFAVKDGKPIKVDFGECFLLSLPTSAQVYALLDHFHSMDEALSKISKEGGSLG